MSNPFPGKRWIKVLRVLAWLSIGWFLFVLLTRLNAGPLNTIDQILVLFGLACIPTALYLARFISGRIHAYEHAYDPLVSHHREALASDEGRPTDQP